MSHRSTTKLLSILALLAIALQPLTPVAALPTPVPAAAAAAVSVQPPAPAMVAPTESAPQPSPASTGTLSAAVRQGKWPAQVAASTGAIRPDVHGPQRTDPAEGISTHAYSPFDERRNREYPCPPGGCEFVKGQVLVKLAPDVPTRKVGGPGALTADAGINAALTAQGIAGMEPIFPSAQPPRAGAQAAAPDGSVIPMPDLTRWYRATLRDASADVFATVESLSQTPGIALAEPDYLRKPVGEVTGSRSQVADSAFNLGPSTFTDPLYAQQWHLAATHVPEAWQGLTDHGLPPGGSRDIVVAVIDTGVDLNHPDLTANLWTNSREIPGNNIDDDGNGFVDDVHGANVVSNQHSGNSMDDHGHGTHVAGIIAAQAGNGIGGVGVAYNTQIMAIKAAQYSGVLTASDIAEGIYYATANGADVINMSFGGYARSQLEEDALAVAFGQAVLVAAAGNDGYPNEGPCVPPHPMYPAAYNWVLGVTASTPEGGRAAFSNYDCIPHTTAEYELMAPGVDVWSTLPNGQYAAWDGTSMAAPMVSGIAALARTKWSDKDVYSSRFIMGQIAANASDDIGGVANAHTALAVAPQPELSYLEHWLFDTTAQAAGNDDDGIVDAGETVDLAIVIRNHWGKADPVSVKLEARAEGAFQPDPYVTMLTDTVDYGAIGSFNQDDNGLIYDAQGVITGVRHPFRFSVDPNTPNNHVIPFRLTMTAGNGYDPDDPKAPYIFISRFNVMVARGRELPRIISEDMTLTKDYYWLVPDQTLIQPGVTVTVTQGTQIQFWTTPPSGPYDPVPNAYLLVKGKFVVQGTATEPVELFPNPLWPRSVRILNRGVTQLQYVRVQNPRFGSVDQVFFSVGDCINTIDHAYFYSDSLVGDQQDIPGLAVHRLSNTIVKLKGTDYIPGFYSAVVVDDGTDTSLFDAVTYLYPWIPFTFNVSSSLRRSVFLPDRSVGIGVITVGAYQAFDSEQEAKASTGIQDNAFLSPLWNPNLDQWTRVVVNWNLTSSQYVGFPRNFWGTRSPALIDASVRDFNDDFNKAYAVYQPVLDTSPATAYPFVVDVVMATSLETNAHIVGSEPVTFTVTFNRDMNPVIQPAVSFGPDVPMTDYTVHPINGGWTNARTWQGALNITPVTGDGYQLIRVTGAVAADDPWLVTGDDAGRFRFEIVTSGTESMNLQAIGGEGRVGLTWTQSDFDLLAGFNLYRATSQNGTYSRINTSIILPVIRAYTDTAVTPGLPYFYKFTVVKSDMTESDFSNVGQGTPLDTIPPVISHTPITSATPGLPLTLFADVTDNVSVQDVILHHRATGTTPYSSQAMVKTTGNRYSATLAGAQVAAPGIEYYVEATDGISTVRHGRPEAPNPIAVVDRPVVTAISPNRGPASGGTAVTIAGSNFKSGATATIGGAICGSLTVVSANQIMCTTPPHFPVAADVVVTNSDSQSGALLRGFTFESDTASLSLPATGGEQGAIVQVPVNAANVNGLAAASLTVTFDPAVLRARAATTGSLTPGWSLVANTTTTGQVRLSMASPGGAVAGSGVLAYIEFEVIGAAGTSSPLALTNVSLNDGAIPVDTAAGSFAVSTTYSVGGTVRTWNGGTGVPGVALALAGDRLYAGLSNAAGAYTVSGARADDYTLTPRKSDSINGVSAYDASLALQHDAGLITLTGYAFTAGDVNKTGAVTSMDAFYILQKAVDLITLPFPGAGVVWTFAPASRSYSSLSANQTGQDFTAVLLGDISGNWSAALAAASTGASSNALVLSLLGGRPDAAGFVTATLYLEPGTTAIHSLDLTLGYDANAASAVAVSPGPSAAGALAQANLAEPGVIRLALASASPLPSGQPTGRPLASLRFRLLDPSTRTSLDLRAGTVNESVIGLVWRAQPLRLAPVYLPLLVR